jgi:hypothetical protein
MQLRCHTEEPIGAAIRPITSEQLFARKREIERQVSAPAPLPAAAAAGEIITFRSHRRFAITYSTATLPAGTVLRVVRRDKNGVVVDYSGEATILPPWHLWHTRDASLGACAVPTFLTHLVHSRDGSTIRGRAGRQFSFSAGWGHQTCGKIELFAA